MKPLKTFLIIDDDTNDRDLFCIALKEVDSSLLCREAEDGEEGLEQLRKQETLPDIIMLDLNMCGMGGKNTLKIIKKEERLKNIPVIIYSTSSSPKDIDETLALGASSYLIKPNNYDGIKDAIRELLQRDWKEGEFHLLEF